MASIVWDKLGDVDNFIEPFCGSAAVLLGRPHAPRIETCNDADCYVANFWRATQQAPEEVAMHADGPVNEADLHARHRWLVLSGEAKTFRERMRTEPDYFDAKVAGWWCWGACCWIGSGWCATTESADWDQTPKEASGLTGVCAKGQDNRKPRIDGGQSQYGHGVHAKGEKRPKLSADNHTCLGTGVHAGGPTPPGTPTEAKSSQQIPVLFGDSGASGAGVHASAGAKKFHGNDGNRPQLADAYSRGRGVNGNDSAGTCEQRRLWLLDWFARLRDRLRTVRVCCGDWLRVCDSESVTTRIGTTGVFFDPPYGDAAGRNMKLYAVDSGSVAADVRAYCLERGADKRMRIVLAGYAGEGHEVLEAAGWDVVEWAAQGGYGNRSDKGKENAKKERLWVSPHCKREATLFS